MNKTNWKINLLPPRIQTRRHRQRLLVWLAAGTAAVVLALGGVYAFIRVSESRTRDRSAALTLQIADIDRAGVEAYEAARDAAAARELTLAFIEREFPPAFDPAWLAAVLGAAPPEVTLHTLDYNGVFITLVASAVSYECVTLHTRLLGESGVFEAVRLGTTESREGGIIRYELRLVPVP
jgi:Tfp pilus assembly protein PilN